MLLVRSIFECGSHLPRKIYTNVHVVLRDAVIQPRAVVIKLFTAVITPWTMQGSWWPIDSTPIAPAEYKSFFVSRDVNDLWWLSCRRTGRHLRFNALGYCLICTILDISFARYRTRMASACYDFQLYTFKPRRRR